MSTKFIFNDITLVKQNPRNDQTFTLSLLCRSYSFFEALGFHYSFSRERKERERERTKWANAVPNKAKVWREERTRYDSRQF